MHGSHRLRVAAVLIVFAFGAPAYAQPGGPPLTLQDALAQARANSQLFRQAQLNANLATEDRKQARAALLPSLNGFSQFIYTEPNGTPSGVWVPNDGPQVYATWLNVHGDMFSLGKWAEYRSARPPKRSPAPRRTSPRAAWSRRRGGLLQAGRRRAEAGQRAAGPARGAAVSRGHTAQERGGEVAHSDVVKAQIQVDQRVRDEQEAELAC